MRRRGSAVPGRRSARRPRDPRMDLDRRGVGVPRVGRSPERGCLDRQQMLEVDAALARATWRKYVPTCERRSPVSDDESQCPRKPVLRYYVHDQLVLTVACAWPDEATATAILDIFGTITSRASDWDPEAQRRVRLLAMVRVGAYGQTNGLASYSQRATRSRPQPSAVTCRRFTRRRTRRTRSSSPHPRRPTRRSRRRRIWRSRGRAAAPAMSRSSSRGIRLPTRALRCFARSGRALEPAPYRAASSPTPVRRATSSSIPKSTSTSPPVGGHLRRILPQAAHMQAALFAPHLEHVGRRHRQPGVEAEARVDFAQKVGV